MFTAQDVKNLREKTGAGMLDCKKALDETKGNIEEAINWLREKGISKAAKKAERIAAEGLSEAVSNDTNAVIVEVNCETDFVARNEEFKTLINTIANTLLNNDVNTMEEANKLVVDNETIEEKVVAFTAKIGEKISFRRFEKLTKTESQEFGIYSHMGGKITSVVVLEGKNPEVAKDIAMHVAAMNPSYLTSNDIPEDVLNKEREIIKEQSMNEGKPAEIAEKMVEGRIRKFFKEVCLVEQEFIKDSSLSVGNYAKNNNCSIVKMVRYEVGEGIEKRNDDFAAEVMNQING
ncbi:MAG: translation elongation factor Ts [Bacilli bacterium]|nr:translation elongation factor Ts [Mycoplasmatota bacterium]MDY4237303.1 translation elongation factor Ts [Bacilli bacterium]